MACCDVLAAAIGVLGCKAAMGVVVACVLGAGAGSTAVKGSHARRAGRHCTFPRSSSSRSSTSSACTTT